MSLSLETLLAHAFQVSFPAPSTKWVDDALDAFADCRDLVVSDVHRKYPAVAADGEFDPQLAGIIETDTTIQAAFLYRVSHVLFLRNQKHPTLRYLACLMKMRTAAEIYYSADIGPGLMIQHGFGLVLGPRHKIGRNFTVYQGVTLGQRGFYTPQEFVTIGDDCIVFAGASVLGTVVIGDNTRIAANAVLLSDAEPNAVYAGVPAVKVKDR